MRTATTTFVVALALALLPALGPAQTPPPPDDAQQAFTRGVAALQASHFADAVVAFHESYRLRPVPTVLYDLALAYRALGQNLEAIDAFQRYVHDAAETVPPARAAAIREALPELHAACGTIALTVDPPGATITVDGRPPMYGSDGGVLLVNPGERVVRADAPGRVAQDRLVRVAAGRREEVSIHLAAVPASLAVATTVCVPGVQVRCACPLGNASVQRCAADGAGFGVCECGEAPAPVVRESHWYGWQVLAVDGGAVALALFALTGSDVPLYISVPVGLVGGPIVHWAHGEVGTGFASLAVRAVIPGIGAIIGAVADSSSTTAVVLSAGVGYAAAVAIDAALFARSSREVPRPRAGAWLPTVAVSPLHGGGMLTLGAAL